MKIDYQFKVDGFYHSVNYYRSETPMNPESMPSPTAVIIEGKTYTDNGVVNKGTYYVRFGSVKADVVKISDEIIVYLDRIIEIFSRKRGYYFNPNIINTMWQDSARTIPAEIGSVVRVIDNLCKLQNVPTYAKSPTLEQSPILRNDIQGNYLEFSGGKCLIVENVLNVGRKLTNFASLEIGSNDTQIILETSQNYNTYDRTLISCIQKVNNIASLTVAAKNSGYSSDLNFNLNGATRLNYISFQEINSTSNNFLKVNGVIINKQQNYTANNFIDSSHFIGSRNNTSLFLNAKMRFIGLVFDGLTTQDLATIESAQSKYL